MAIAMQDMIRQGGVWSSCCPANLPWRRPRQRSSSPAGSADYDKIISLIRPPHSLATLPEGRPAAKGGPGPRGLPGQGRRPRPERNF